MATTTDQHIDQLSEMLAEMVKGLLEGKGLVIQPMQVMGAYNSGKKLAGVDGAGKQVFQRLMNEVMREHPEIIDLLFDGLSEAAKNRVRKMIAVPEVKDAKPA